MLASTTTTAGPQFDPAAVGFPGGAPAFPGTDTLTPDAFKVVVASWRRINPATTSTSDFACDVSTYAPRGPFVKRVQLVDAQVPNTQTLIEEPWCRLWLSMGVPMTPDFRRMDVEVAVGDAVASTSIVFPLPVSRVDSATVVQPGVTRLVLQDAAPCPAVAMVGAWAAFGGRVVLAGVPGLVTPGAVGLVLARDMVQNTGFPCGLDVFSAALAAAVQAPGFNPSCITLVASRLPSDDALARTVSWAMTMAMANTSLCAGPVRLLVSYCAGSQEDHFKLQLQGPTSVRHWLRFLPGSLATYMGLDSVPLLAGTPVHRAPAARVQPPGAYARLPCSNYVSPAALAAAVSAAASAYTWPPFDVSVTVPGSDVLTGHVDGGHGTVEAVATAVEAALGAVVPAGLGLQVAATQAGLVFASSTGIVFRVQLPAAPNLGFTPSYLTPWGTSHAPNDYQGPHVPLWCGCDPFPADVQATVNSKGHLVVRSTPFAPFAVTAAAAPVACTAGWWVVTPTSPTFLAGLLPGAMVDLVAADLSGHVVCVVLAAEAGVPGGPFTVQQLDATVPFEPTGRPLVATPMDAPPLTLYMQTAGALVNRTAPVPASLLGFQPDTYTSVLECGWGPCGAPPLFVLVSPGTVRVRADPFLLLCLSFYAADANVLTGDVYYPLETPSGGSQLVFAQVLRCGSEFRSDYERVFNHSFPGAGMHLGYIRVKVLNADGTLYQSHGHPVSVCLRMDVMTDHISLGGPSHMALVDGSGPGGAGGGGGGGGGAVVETMFPAHALDSRF